MRICELREKEVINIRDCQRLGRVLDIEFDLHTGVICQLILPGPSRFCGFFGRDAEYLIGWKCIRQISFLWTLISKNVCKNRRIKLTCDSQLFIINGSREFSLLYRRKNI